MSKDNEIVFKGWVARDKGNGINFSWIKPTKYEDLGIWLYAMAQELPDDLFPDVKWTDEEPTAVEETIKLKKK